LLKEEGKELVRNGRNGAGNQQYYCKNRGKYFVETKNTLFYHSHLDREEVIIVC